MQGNLNREILKNPPPCKCRRTILIHLSSRICSAVRPARPVDENGPLAFARRRILDCDFVRGSARGRPDVSPILARAK